ncbi:MAG: prepilin-type N-terminal cleavage/methylation domain-containing protein [Sedimentisphaerales bacterium]|nr:prepilin-type N-terminal cleavage/methylation domain-containing protein [Sedimentisphaerales bacterium]
MSDSRSRRKKGVTIVEVIISVLILVIVILGSAFLYAYGTGFIGVGKRYRQANQLAAQKLEQLRADNHFNRPMPLGTTSEPPITLGYVDYTRTTEITEAIDPTDQNLGSCKKVKVTVSWTQGGRDREVSLVSLYVDRGGGP